MLVIFILLLFVTLKSIIFSLHPYMIFLLLNFVENMVMIFKHTQMSDIVIFLNNLLFGPIKHNLEYDISIWLGVQSPLTYWVVLGVTILLILYILSRVIEKKIRKNKIDRFSIYEFIFTFIYIQYSWTTIITTQFLINLVSSDFWILFSSILYLTLITFGLQATFFNYIYGKKSFFYRRRYNWLIYYQKPDYKWFILYLFIEKIIYSLSWIIGTYSKITTFLLLNLLNFISLLYHIKFHPFKIKMWNTTFIINKIILLFSSIYSIFGYYLINNGICNTIFYIILLTCGLIINCWCSIRYEKMNYKKTKVIEMVKKTNIPKWVKNEYKKKSEIIINSDIFDTNINIIV